MPSFRVTKVNDNAILPERQHLNDAGLDLYSVENVRIGYLSRQLVKTGIVIEIPSGYAGFIQPRSGLALKNGVTVLNTPGLIDSGYRGELGVLLYNSDNLRNYHVKQGDRIAQLVIISTPIFTPVEVETLSISDRNEGGFGSTDEKTIR